MTPDETRQVLAVAVLAPSVHNTQPWTFTVSGDVIEVRADRSRGLSAQDPNGRELLISCGGAVLHAQLGVRALDRECRVEWLPVPSDPDLLARVVVGGPALAHAEERRLLDAAPLRHTDRSAFAAEEVPVAVVDELRRAAELYGCWLLDVWRPEDVVELDVLVARADRLLRQDRDVAAEIAQWVRPGEHPAEGLPAGALPGHGEGRASSLTLRDFEPGEQPPVPGPADPPRAERPLLLVLGTEADTPDQWLLAGAALARVLLVATAAGLVANPQTQVMEVPALREQMTSRLNIVGRPQLLLRAGWPTGPGSAHPGRRPVSEVLQPGSAATD